MASQEGPESRPTSRPQGVTQRSRSAFPNAMNGRDQAYAQGGPVSMPFDARGGHQGPGMAENQIQFGQGFPAQGGQLPNSPNRQIDARPGTAGGRQQNGARGRGRGAVRPTGPPQQQFSPNFKFGEFPDFRQSQSAPMQQYQSRPATYVPYNPSQAMVGPPAYMGMMPPYMPPQPVVYPVSSSYNPQMFGRPNGPGPDMHSRGQTSQQRGMYQNHNAVSSGSNSAKVSPVAQSVRPRQTNRKLTITNPNTNEEVDLGVHKSPKSPSVTGLSTPEGSAKKQPNPVAPSGQHIRPEPAAKKVLSISSPPESMKKHPAQGGPSGQAKEASSDSPLSHSNQARSTPAGGPSKSSNQAIAATKSSAPKLSSASTELKDGIDESLNADTTSSIQSAQTAEAVGEVSLKEVATTTQSTESASNSIDGVSQSGPSTDDAEALSKAAAEAEAAEKAALKKSAAEKAAQEKAAAEKAAAEKAEAEKLAAQKAAEQKEAADKAAAQKAAEEKAAAEKLAAEKAALEEKKREEAEQLAAKERAEREAEEAKAREEAAAEVKAVEEAATAQREAATSSIPTEDVRKAEEPKVYMPSKKLSGKKLLKASIANKEAAEKAGDMMSAYTTPQAKPAEPEQSEPPTAPQPTAQPAPPPRPASQEEEEDNWEDIQEPAPVSSAAEAEGRKSYTADFLKRIERDLRDSGAIDNWLLTTNIESATSQILMNGPNMSRPPPSGRVGLRSANSGRLGNDKWSQKGPLPGPGQAPGLAVPPHARPMGNMGRQDVVNGGDNWRRRDPLPPAPPPMRAPELHKATNKYQRGKLISENPDEERRQKDLKSLLNKITPEKYTLILEKLLQVEIPTALSLSGLIDQVYEKGVTEPTFTELYARLCYDVSQKVKTFQPEPGSEDTKEITFRRLLLNKCQEEFQEGKTAMSAVKAREQGEAAAAKEAEEGKAGELEDGEIKTKTLEERKKEAAEALAEQKARWRALGNMQFVGYLYKHRLIAEKIMHECIRALLEDVDSPRREDIECLCKLISTIGLELDQGKLRSYIEPYFQRMEQMSKVAKLEARLKFMIQDVIDLRRNNWQQRRKVEGPKTIDEIHRDAQMEQLAAQRNDFRSGRGGPMGNRSSFRESQLPARPLQPMRRMEEEKIRPMQRNSSQESFAPGGRPGGMFRPGGSLAARNQSPATRDQPAASSQTTSSGRATEAAEAQPLSQAASIDPEDAKIKGWDDMFIIYGSDRDVDKARRIIRDILIPRAERPAQAFDKIFSAAVEKKEVKQDLVQEIFELIVKEELIQTEEVIEGISSMLESVADVVMDAAFVPNMIGNLIGALVVLEKTQLKDMGDCILEAAAKPPKDEDAETLLDSGNAAKILAVSLQYIATKKDKDAAKSMWQATGFEITPFLAEFDREDDRAVTNLRQRNGLEGIL